MRSTTLQRSQQYPERGSRSRQDGEGGVFGGPASVGPGVCRGLLHWKREYERKARLQSGDSTQSSGLELVFESHVAGRHYHTAPIQQDYICPAGCCLLECPKCGAAVGVWCQRDGPVPNGGRLPLHEERWAAAGKNDGSMTRRRSSPCVSLQHFLQHLAEQVAGRFAEQQGIHSRFGVVSQLDLGGQTQRALTCPSLPFVNRPHEPTCCEACRGLRRCLLLYKRAVYRANSSQGRQMFQAKTIA